MKDAAKAIYCSNRLGPTFGHTQLCMYEEPFDDTDNCRSDQSKTQYEISDANGKSQLTLTNEKFTATEIECFLVV